MKFISIRKVFGGRFIHRYDITYETEEGREKIYEMISRNPEVSRLEDLQKKKRMRWCWSCTMRAGKSCFSTGSSAWRRGSGCTIFRRPDRAGEAPEESAARELREETGLELVKIKEILPISYSAVGFSNETNLCIVGTAEGKIRKSDSPAEEIEAGWYTKKEVRHLLQNELFAGRTQAYSYLWSRE